MEEFGHVDFSAVPMANEDPMRAGWSPSSGVVESDEQVHSSALWRTHADRVPRPMDVHTARTARLRVHGVARASTRGRDRRV